MKNILRIIPVLFIKNGLIVRSQNFIKHQFIGNVIEQAQRLNDYNVDELIYIDISKNDEYDLGRDDLLVKSNNDIISMIQDISKICFMPLSFGGKIRTVKDATDRIRAGADKIILNSLLYENNDILKNIIRELGSQAVVASIDYKIINDKLICHKNAGQINTNIEILNLIEKLEKIGVGEIFLQNIDYDGSKKGYDLKNITKINNNTSLPLIACSGAGAPSDFIEAAKIKNLSALAAGNYFNFKERSYPNIKKECRENKINVR